MSIRNEIIEPDHFYHIFNRGNNKQSVFNNEDNYKYFLTKLNDYSRPVLDIYAYCLMPNHFHLVIKVKSEIELEKFSQTTSKRKTFHNGLHAKDKIVSKQIAKLLSAYTQAFNKRNNRSGSLFDSPFKRKRIDSETYLRNSVIYIHQNPKDIGENYKTYKYSSYTKILSNSLTTVKRQEVIELFDDLDNFKYLHNRNMELDDDF